MTGDRVEAIVPYTCPHCGLDFHTCPGFRVDPHDVLWVVNATGVSCGHPDHGDIAWGLDVEVWAVVLPALQWAWLAQFANPEQAMAAASDLWRMMGEPDDPHGAEDYLPRGQAVLNWRRRHHELDLGVESRRPAVEVPSELQP